MSYKGFIKTSEEYNLLVSLLENKQFEDFEGSRFQKSRLLKKSSNFVLIDRRLYLFCENGNHKKVISQDSRDIRIQKVLGLHLSTHYGQNKMEDMCCKLFFSIPRSIIREVVNNCHVCKQAQPLKEKKTVKHILAKLPFERVQVDCVDLHKYSNVNDGYKWIMTVVDVFSKFAFVFPLKSKSSMEIKRCLEKLVTSEGAFKILQTDNGLEFKNSIVDEFCHNYLMQRIYGRPRHPQSQGIVERFNQTITRYLQKHLFSKHEDNKEEESKRWIDILDLTVYNYNISAYESTKKSPFVLFKNRDGFNTCLSPCYKIENVNLSKDYKEARANQAKYFETRFVDKQKTNIELFKIGEKVFVQKDFDNNTKTKKKKLESFYEGPFEVKEILENDILVLVSEEKVFKVNSSRCKRL